MDKPSAWGRGRGQQGSGKGAWGTKNDAGARPNGDQKDKSSMRTASSAARGSAPGQQSGTSKFEEACQKISASSKKFLANDEFVSSEEEDDDEGLVSNKSAVLSKILNSYSGGDHSSKDDLGRTQQFLEDALKSGANVCLICIATVKKNEAIWSCGGCYCIFHLPCIQTWAKDSILQLTTGSDKNQRVFWCCPKCRFEYQRHDCPSKYLCFCGKEADPKFDPWLVPHACGQVCSKPLQPDCGHKCNLLCHPGPCPPCPKTVQVACQCGKQKPQTRRCSARQWYCAQRCGKLLACKQHLCTDNCHEGSCKPCLKTSQQFCLCRQEKSNRLCAEPIWQCQNVCGKKLSCGHHNCETVCHSGNCDDCPRSKQRYCPCGKSSFNLPCIRDIPACGDTCGKPLACQAHFCAHRCHHGPCSTCMQMSVKRCRCGAKEKSMPCHKEFTCDIKCKYLKDCRKHACNKKCCNGNCSPCEQPCGRSLGCRNHKCNSRCHLGPCYPCPLMVEVKCHCGASAVKVPCGREKLTPPPKCGKRCGVAPLCHHKQQTPHRCHFGSCPACKQTCDKDLDCGHSCPASCHSAVLTKIKVEQIRAGPWEPVIAPRIELVCQPCPPCKVPVPITCFGQHETQDFACFMAKPGSCHRKCGRKLSCGNHGCSLDCHVVDKAPDKKKAGANCSKCEMPCTAKRPDGCRHPCPRRCHSDSCQSCSQMTRLRCHCGQVNSLYVKCSEWLNAASDDKSRMQSCGNQCPLQLSCGHGCTQLCHSGACSAVDSCVTKVLVKCPCKTLKKEFKCCHREALECSNACKQKQDAEKKAKQSAEQKRRQEEQKLESEELERYQRRFEGRKRKPRKDKEVVAEDNSHKYKWMIASVAGIGLVAAFFYALLRINVREPVNSY